MVVVLLRGIGLSAPRTGVGYCAARAIGRIGPAQGMKRRGMKRQGMNPARLCSLCS
jgi:hypothetical protein